MISTPAKVNLYLEVLGKRSDGYHEINTVFAPLWDLTDDVDVAETDEPGISLVHSGRPVALPEGSANICTIAAERFCQTFGIPPRHKIFLTKRIPVSAGLGGGSSDAATVLLEMCRIHGINPRISEVAGLAASLGADVPFFLSPGICAATGIGDVLTPVFDDSDHRLNRRLAIVYPKFPSPVATAYRLADKASKKSPEQFSDFLKDLKNGKLPTLAFRNDLGDTLIEKFPLLAMLCDELFCQGAIAPTISGSGSSVFALLPKKWNEFFQDRIVKAMDKFNVEVFFSDI